MKYFAILKKSRIPFSKITKNIVFIKYRDFNRIINRVIFIKYNNKKKFKNATF